MLNITNKSSLILWTSDPINTGILSKVNISQYKKKVFQKLFKYTIYIDELCELYSYLNEYTFMNSVNISY